VTDAAATADPLSSTVVVRCLAFPNVVRSAADSLLAEALAGVRSIQDDWRRTRLVADLAPRLSDTVLFAMLPDGVAASPSGEGPGIGPRYWRPSLDV